MTVRNAREKKPAGLGGRLPAAGHSEDVAPAAADGGEAGRDDSAATGEGAEGYRLAPQTAIDRESSDTEPMYRWSRSDVGDDDAPAESYQFSLGQMLLLAAVVSFVLSILNLLPPQYAAGVAGLGALVSLIVISVLKPAQAIVHVTWWAMLLVYLMMCLAAILNQY